MSPKRVAFSDKGPRSTEMIRAAQSAGFQIVEMISGEDIFCDATLLPELEKMQLLKSVMPKVGGSELILIHTVSCTVAPLSFSFHHPEKVVGFGYIGPFAESSVIELAEGPETDQTAMQAAAGFFQQLGKQTEIVSDAVGMVGPRILCCLVNEACSALESGICNQTDLDVAMRLGTNYPHGLMDWGERIGFKEIELILNSLRALGGGAYRPNPFLRRLALQEKLPPLTR